MILRNSFKTIIISFMIFSGILISPWIENVKSNDCGDPPSWPVISGYIGWNNWYISYVVVTFVGIINNTFYRIDEGNWTKYITYFSIKTEGIHLLEWACDSNLSEIYSMNIMIDFSPPTAQITMHKISLLTWKAVFDVYDEISGINKVWFEWTNSTDTEPPYEFIWHGSWWWISFWSFIYTLFLGYNTDYPFDAWDNAGNHILF
ncbi:MAG: hypothetical protein JW840_02295 [Candidatus Thermoplasmatota archaeon]|nr:hypothetical protein [Candidatus Thermoplasmatota archaeon]